MPTVDIALPHIIVVTDNGYVNGGSGKVALTSARLLADAGYRVTVFCAVGPIDPTLEHAGIDVVCIDQHDILSHPNRIAAMVQGIWNAKAQHRFQALLAKHDPTATIVHVHSWTKALSSSVIHTAAAGGFPIVVTLHDYFSICPTGSLFNHQRQEKCLLTPMSVSCIKEHCDPRSYSQKLWRVARQFVQQSYGDLPGKIRHFITISNFSEALIRPRQAFQDTVFHRVPNPIEIQEAAPSTPVAHRNFLFLGRLSQEKGPVLFARAAKAAGVHAQFVGSGECDAAIRAVNPQAELTGWLDPEQSVLALRNARALVFPSLWYETLGLTVLEAMAVGVPVIVPSNSASAEEVVHERTGLIFESGNEAALEQAIRRLSSDDALVARLGQAAYTTFWQNPPSTKRHIEALHSVYADMIA